MRRMCCRTTRPRSVRCSGDGSRAVRSEGLHVGAGRYSHQLGTACRSECAGCAAGLRGLGRFDALAMEVAPFGVRVCTLEPGGIRTNWARRADQNAPDVLPDYEASVGSMLWRWKSRRSE